MYRKVRMHVLFREINIKKKKQQKEENREFFNVFECAVIVTLHFNFISFV